MAKSVNPEARPSRRLPELDGIRAIAILLVISFHSWYNLRSFFSTHQEFADFTAAMHWIFAYPRRGDLGVDIFFVLSGFLLSWQLFTQRRATGQLDYMRYFAHRVFRIYPLYLVALAIALAVKPTWHVLGNLFAYNIWFDMRDIVIPWSWSLSVEIEFYLIIPFLILIITGARSLIAVLLLACAAGVVWTFWTLSENPALRIHTLGELFLMGDRDQLMVFFSDLYIAFPIRVSQFLFGTAAAWLIVHHAARFERLSRPATLVLALVAVAGLLLPALNNPYIPQTDLNRLFMNADYAVGRFSFALGIALLIMLMLVGRLTLLRRILSADILQPVAKYSFSMYLFHPIFVHLGAYLAIGLSKVSSVAFWQVFITFLVAVAGSMLLGALTWKFIEKPSITYGKKRFDR